jgi:hypothetical protein
MAVQLVVSNEIIYLVKTNNFEVLKVKKHVNALGIKNSYEIIRVEVHTLGNFLSAL